MLKPARASPGPSSGRSQTPKLRQDDSLGSALGRMLATASHKASTAPRAAQKSVSARTNEAFPPVPPISFGLKPKSVELNFTSSSSSNRRSSSPRRLSISMQSFLHLLPHGPQTLSRTP